MGFWKRLLQKLRRKIRRRTTVGLMAVSPYAVGEAIDLGAGKRYCMLKDGAPDGYGIVFLPQYTVTQVHWEKGSINGRVVVADFHKKVLKCVCEVEKGIVKSLEDISKLEWDIIDLTEDGKRWEGDTLDGVPFGWGVYYDQDNSKLYEGFRIQDTAVCYGLLFHELMTTDTVYYRGLICEGKRWGMGELYDRNSKLVYEGDWINDTNDYQTVTVPSSSLALSDLHSLMEELVIGDYCCADVPTFCIEKHTRLHHLRVGHYSFSSKHANEETSFRLVDLPMLESIMIGNHSFEYYVNLVMRGTPTRRPLSIDLPRLTALTIGESEDYAMCFKYCRRVRIIGFPLLKRIQLGGYVFSHLETLVIDGAFRVWASRTDLPELETLLIGEHALDGNKKISGKEVVGLLSSLRNSTCMIKGGS